ncbi:MAG TPA: PIG-L deacetylase family protein [Acidimicrobiales bacterium]|nr:PIG-L deacetylase family protein [Acidimicrobiales bacterium]
MADELEPPAIAIDDAAGAARVLVVTAHPDDVDFGVAGSVAVWVKAGIEVSYCVVTDGDAGGSDRSVSREEMAVLRREEQRAAAAEVGVSDVTFLGYPDGRLTPGLDLRRDLSRQLRKVRPDRLVCQSPERNWDRIGASHPDHLAAGEAALCAAYPDARNPFAHRELLEEEGLEPFSVAEVWLMASPRANRAVDITDVFELKLAALRRHRSQVGEGEWLDQRLRGWFSEGARLAGLDEGRLAETFQVVGMPDTGSS